MQLPEKDYERLQTLCTRWGMSQDDIYYAIESDLLRVCVWLPLRYIERRVFENSAFIYEQHEPKEGFVCVRPNDLHKICSTGYARLRSFRSVNKEGHILRLAYEPPQPSIAVGIHDLVVLKEDRINFEKTYNVSKQSENV